MSRPTETQVDEAFRVLQADYYSDVREIAKYAIDEIKNGNIKEVEDLDTWLHQTIDGYERVIYTNQARLVGVLSDNRDVGLDELGMESFDFSDGIPHEALAYCAMRRDVQEQLEAEGIDLNDPRPETDEDCSG